MCDFTLICLVTINMNITILTLTIISKSVDQKMPTWGKISFMRIWEKTGVLFHSAVVKVSFKQSLNTYEVLSRAFCVAWLHLQDISGFWSILGLERAHTADHQTDNFKWISTDLFDFYVILEICCLHACT